MKVAGYALFVSGAVALGLGIALPAARPGAVLAGAFLVGAGILVPWLSGRIKRRKQNR
jgi:hypothetical protein